ncbi:TetR/AcrR family transcriptional regulator [Nocardioides mangrovi]|uniref:TetR/AcrR family transcriptional regulator n=1 Tax=Nocardioides mangrovi TaxID=2874580 RepID=A0ABS7U8P9_9ACTN|nr:TetR/AcrR family transcriptional regulator [Nocardioides mangrovi]MBZ5737359.1 TetR/AcrR family transcriptional regulator [Nocardioides mangrovi]
MTQRDQLLAAAERLFADQGVDATSLRAVMAAAGTNVAAVNYHFGSKDALLAEVIRHRSGTLRAEREERLVALEDADPPDVHALAETIVGPVAALARRGDDAWIRLVNSIAATRREPGWTLLNETFAPQADRLAAVLLRIHPNLRRTTLRFRMAEATSMAFRVVGDLDFVRRNVGSAARPASVDAVVADLTEAVAAILGGSGG